MINLPQNQKDAGILVSTLILSKSQYKSVKAELLTVGQKHLTTENIPVINQFHNQTFILQTQ